jgi:hypothetical protein
MQFMSNSKIKFIQFHLIPLKKNIQELVDEVS